MAGDWKATSKGGFLEASSFAFFFLLAFLLFSFLCFVFGFFNLVCFGGALVCLGFFEGWEFLFGCFCFFYFSFLLN